jgi:hypothetical protein
MRCLVLSLLAVALVVTTSHAGPNFAGVLNVHDAGLVYSVGTFYCGLGTAPPDCESTDTRLDGTADGAARVWKVYAMFYPCGSSPRLKTMSFGLEYDADNLSVEGFGACSDAETPGPGGPSPQAGTSLTWNSAQCGPITEAYWFAGYNYYGRPQIFRVGPHPTLGGWFGDDSVPPIPDQIAGYGSLGFDTPGQVVCVAPLSLGACCLPDHTCILATESVCLRAGGAFLGACSSCDPYPCVGSSVPDPRPTSPARRSSWGAVKGRYR